MPLLRKKIVVLGILIVATVPTFLWWLKIEVRERQPHEAFVLSESKDVRVTATVSGCLFNITVRPEKRIPRTNNWDTILNVSLVNTTDNNNIQFTVNTNIWGTGSTNLCDLGFTPTYGVYNLKVRGASHLFKAFNLVSTFKYIESSLSFIGQTDQLFAGDVSVVRDNYINSLDIVEQVDKLYSNDYINDLNQDGAVNSLDISNSVTNLYMWGD